MRGAAFASILTASAAACATEPDTSSSLPSNGGAEPTSECRAEAKRELEDYFRGEFRGQEAFLDIEYLRADTGPHDTAAPAYYLWVRASTRDARIYYRTGAARVVIATDFKCNVAGFIPKADILVLASRGQMETYFPPKLIPKILSKAETAQK
jgi:hypothetical protein